MNVRIFWVRAMKCMCAQTRPQFILSSERVFGGMEFELMLTPREKSPLPENVPRGGSNPWRCGQRAQALPTELFRPPRPRPLNLDSRCVVQVYIYPLSSLCISTIFLPHFKEASRFVHVWTQVNVKDIICIITSIWLSPLNMNHARSNEYDWDS